MLLTENGNKVKAKHIKMSFVVLTILFVLTLAGFAWILIDVRDLSHKSARLSAKTAELVIENQHRVNDIQNSRVKSCKRTYEGVREIFSPFFPKKHQQTKKEKINIHKFNHTINFLKNRCSKQTRPIKSSN